jgi:Pectic acid lyase
MLSVRAFTLFLLVLLPLHASVLGVSKAAEALTEARVMTLPVAQRGPWFDYLKRSAEQMHADKAVLAAERVGLKEIPPLPKQHFSARSIPLHRAPEFYKSDEARHIGDVILSFQTAAGGWSKNLDMGGPARLRGQSYATANLAPVGSGPGDFDEAADENWHYVGTLDNDATNTELHFLAELSAALPGHEGDAYRAAALRGIEYLLHAQFPNGGWPQVWPLEGGYHDAITFNDDAVTESAEVLTLAAKGARVAAEKEEDEISSARVPGTAEESQQPMEDYSFVPASLRMKAKAALRHRDLAA